MWICLAKICDTLRLSVMFRLKGTVILVIWWKVLLVTLYAIGIVCIHTFVFEISFKLSFVSIVGVITGLLSVFRTNTAYDKFWDGRKLWSTLVLQIRIISRIVWVLGTDKELSKEEQNEKLSIIKLIVAFAYATKNLLRGVNSYEEKDLHQLLHHFPERSTMPSGSDHTLPKTTEETGNIRHRKSAKLKKAKSRNKVAPEENSSENSRQQSPFTVSSPDIAEPLINIPVELSWGIAKHINSLQERGLADEPTVTIMNTALNVMTDCLGGFERILKTPLPKPYSVHLQHVTWVYFLALPCQLVDELDWFTIPAVALISFSLLGIHGICGEIEYPFGHDDNDLPLDDFCEVVYQEILTITEHTLPSPDSWLVSDEYRPFFPDSDLTASVLSNMEEEKLREFLTEIWLIRKDSD